MMPRTFSASSLLLSCFALWITLSSCVVYEHRPEDSADRTRVLDDRRFRSSDGVGRDDFQRPPPPRTRIYDYQHRSLKDITEEQRIDFIINNYGDELQQDYEGGAATSPQKSWPKPVTPVTSLQGIRVPQYYDVRPYRVRIRSSYSPYSCRVITRPSCAIPRYRHFRHRHYRCGDRFTRTESFGIGNTLLFGTLGGVIGHQSGRRDEGILIGAGYGLLRDLLTY